MFLGDVKNPLLGKGQTIQQKSKAIEDLKTFSFIEWCFNFYAALNSIHVLSVILLLFLAKLQVLPVLFVPKQMHYYHKS